MVGHQGGWTSLKLKMFIQVLAAQPGRKAAAALRSHKQDVRNTLPQYTHAHAGPEEYPESEPVALLQSHTQTEGTAITSL